MLPKCSMELQANNYYVIIGTSPSGNRTEQILVFYKGKETYIERDDGQYGPEIKHHFIVVAWLGECSEGAPEPGQRELVSDDDLKDMQNQGFSFREPTPTEMVLYGRA